MRDEGTHQILANQFLSKTITVLIIASIAIRLPSFTLLLLSPSSNSLHIMIMFMESASFVSSILAIYSLFKQSVVGGYAGIFYSVFVVSLGSFNLLKATYNSQLDLSSALQPVASSVLGGLTLICLFRMQPNRIKTFGLKDEYDVEANSDLSPRSDNEVVVETIDVTKKYYLGPNVVSAINGISIKIRRGEFVAIMGPSGSGKSTLLNLLGALDRPSSGRVLIDGLDISLLNDVELAKLRNEKIGFVFQAYNLIARSTVLRNIELPALVKGYGKEERLRRIENLLNMVGLNGKSSRKPKTLSGGEQQRVAIARALINNPEIILADEPTGNVDSKTGKMIIDFLRKLSLENRATVIVVTHNLEVANAADRVLYLRDGRIVKEEVVGRLMK